MNDFCADAAPSISLLDQFVDAYRLCGVVCADHLCYKCCSPQTFEMLRAFFEHESMYFHQAIISRRRIACIKLTQGITTSVGTITCLELSDQKPDMSQSSCFDHVEIYPVGITYDALVEYLMAKSVVLTKDKKPHHTTWNTILPNGFEIKLTREPLFEKIRREMRP